MQRIKFITNEIYHIYNKGISGYTLFKDLRDYLHFLSCLTEFNTLNNVEMRFAKNFYITKAGKQNTDSRLIEIISYCLMPTHFHLIIKQTSEKGIIRYMQKLGTGYTMYHHKRYNTEGHIFQGTYRVQHLSSSQQLLIRSAYIHINPLKKSVESLTQFKLEENQLMQLKEYPWSSLIDYYDSDSKIRSLKKVTELEIYKPKVTTEIIQSYLGINSYEFFIKNCWEKDVVNKIDIDKKMA